MNDPVMAFVLTELREMELLDGALTRLPSGYSGATYYARIPLTDSCMAF